MENANYSIMHNKFFLPSSFRFSADKFSWYLTLFKDLFIFSPLFCNWGCQRWQGEGKTLLSKWAVIIRGPPLLLSRVIKPHARFHLQLQCVLFLTGSSWALDSSLNSAWNPSKWWALWFSLLCWDFKFLCNR